MEDFKSAASAIPPPRHVVRKLNSTKPFRFPLIINTVTLKRGAWKMRDYSNAAFSLELDYLAIGSNQLSKMTVGSPVKPISNRQGGLEPFKSLMLGFILQMKALLALTS